MKINKEQLQKALEIVKPGLSSKEIIEQATSFAFIDGRVVTYNDEISISHPVPGLELSGAIQAEKLYPFLSKVKKDEIEIEVNDNELVITSGRSKAGLTLQSEIKLPISEEIAKKGKWKLLPETFLKHVDFAMTSCSRDMSRPVLTCLHIEENYIEASDSFRITRCILNEKMQVKAFLLPATSAIHIVKLNPTHIAEGNGWVHFKTSEETVISCRIFEDSYPVTESFFKTKGIEITLPKTTLEIIDRAAVFAKRDHILDEVLIVTLENKRFKIRAESTNGWIEEETNIKYSGDVISFMITPYLLKGILSETLVCHYCKDRLLFVGENWKYLTILK